MPKKINTLQHHLHLNLESSSWKPKKNSLYVYVSRSLSLSFAKSTIIIITVSRCVCPCMSCSAYVKPDIWKVKSIIHSYIFKDLIRKTNLRKKFDIHFHEKWDDRPPRKDEDMIIVITYFTFCLKDKKLMVCTLSS